MICNMNLVHIHFNYNNANHNIMNNHNHIHNHNHNRASIKKTRTRRPRGRGNHGSGSRCTSNSPKGSHNNYATMTLPPPPPLPLSMLALRPPESVHIKSAPISSSNSDIFHNHMKTPFLGSSTTTFTGRTSTVARSPKDLSKMRRHLKGVQVLRKKSILVTGLKRSRSTPACQSSQEFTFHSLSAVRDYFESRFGRICKCVENPKGFIESELSSSVSVSVSVSSPHKLADQNEGQLFGAVFITFTHDKSASFAVRDMNGHGTRVRFGYIPYCNEFLNGRYCRDLDCVLVHEDTVSVSPRSLSVENSFKESFKTIPTILRKEATAASASASSSDQKRAGTGAVTALEMKNCWDSPARSFLMATKGIRSSNRQGRDTNTTFPANAGGFANEIGTIKIATPSRLGSADEDLASSDSHSIDDTDTCSGTNDTSCGNFQLMVTPDSTLTKSTFSSRMSMNDGTPNNLNGRSPSEDAGSNISLHTNIAYGEVDDHMDLPAKQLFANQVSLGVISPPEKVSEEHQRLPQHHQHQDKNQYQHNLQEHGQRQKTFSSPWDIQSPFQLEKDNFDALKTNHQKPTTALDTSYIAANPNDYFPTVPISMPSTWSTTRNPGPEVRTNNSLIPRPSAFPPFQSSTCTAGTSFPYNQQQQQQQQQNRLQPQFSMQFPNCYQQQPHTVMYPYQAMGMHVTSGLMNYRHQYFQQARRNTAYFNYPGR